MIWKDISEAKRDGSFIIACEKSDPTTAVAVQLKTYAGEDCWVRKSGLRYFPTHFMELPALEREAQREAAE